MPNPLPSNGRQEMPWPGTEQPVLDAEVVTQEYNLMNPDPNESLATHIKTLYREARNAKNTVIEEWKTAWRNNEGRYDGTTLARIKEIGSSEVFVKVTSTKVTAAKSLIMQVHTGPRGFRYTMRPTPIPEMEDIRPSDLNDLVTQALQEIPPEQQGQFLQEMNPQAILDKIKDEAASRARKMRRQIDDYLVEMDWSKQFVHSLDPLTIYGTNVFQGPLSVRRKKKYWVPGENGTWKAALRRRKAVQEEETDEVRPEMRHLSPWNVFPSPGARTVDECEYIVVRHVLAPHQIRKLRFESNYDAEAIDAVLSETPDKGDWTPETWETMLDSDDTGTSNTVSSGKFVVYECWKWFTGKELKRFGVSVTDELDNVDVVAQIHVLGERVIKAVVENYEPARLPFIFCPYEPVDGRIWGKGIPEQMSDSQTIWNATQRMMIDNARASSSFRRVVDKALLAMNDDGKDYPFKTYWIDSNKGSATHKPVDFFQPQNNVAQMQAIQQGVRLHMQMETKIPDFATGIPGAQGHNRTAEGIAMQRGMALSYIRSVIASMDENLVAPMIESLYHWAMNYEKSDEIKGDYEVDAGGVMEAISEDALSTAIDRLFMNPAIAPYLKIDKIVPEITQRAGLAELDLVYSQEEVEAMQARSQRSEAEIQAEAKRVSPEMPKLNALVQVFSTLPDTSPARPNVLKSIMEALGLFDEHMAASINAMNEEAASRLKATMTEDDFKNLSMDYQAQEMMNQGGDEEQAEPLFGKPEVEVPEAVEGEIES